MRTVDFIIVGQGLAGTLLAYELMQQNQQVYLIDNQHFEAASNVAAGLINPITGRRIVKTAQIDTLLPMAKMTYQSLEKELGVSLWQERDVLWALAGIKEENDWYLRAAQPGICDYITQKPDYQDILTQVKTVKNFGEVRHAAQVDVPLLISAFAKKCLSEDCLLQENFRHNELIINDNEILYKDIKAQKIIFCEGHRGRFNPFFSNEAFNVAKGEALIIKAEGLPKQKILKENITICPLSDGTFWVGSNYEWQPEHSMPSESIRQELEKTLNDFLAIPYEIINHKAAIRPTMKNREILLATHSIHSNVFIFNGLGTKGTSLAPFWAKKMAEFSLRHF